ncbi:hypothetical protein [Neorhodopirellula pilleata]|uniref:Uncharacterized protein n=1 Tax=Neorhodopirellula pilleata TaxID=2714738 RepID=A0A5C6AHS8_9BACT|nr:hypothetical protein [Neorhodopirellula pilleata]TWT98745.1 hypothetical protein Pla100_19110 [Neorhodopirellula pilleata]
MPGPYEPHMPPNPFVPPFDPPGDKPPYEPEEPDGLITLTPPPPPPPPVWPDDNPPGMPDPGPRPPWWPDDYDWPPRPEEPVVIESPLPPHICGRDCRRTIPITCHRVTPNPTTYLPAIQEKPTPASSTIGHRLMNTMKNKRPSQFEPR